MSRCPTCGSFQLVAQDIDEITNPVSLMKLMERLQLRCEHCGWIGYEQAEIQQESMFISKDMSGNFPAELPNEISGSSNYHMFDDDYTHPAFRSKSESNRIS